MSDLPADGRREHPEASLALGLGLLGLAGGLLVLPLFISPFAMLLGRRVLAEIDAAPEELTGRGKARAGCLLGLAGTVALAAFAVVLAVLVAVSFIDVVTGDGVAPAGVG